MSFVEITGQSYKDLLEKRVRGEVPELIWLKQVRSILRPQLKEKITLLDIGCAMGHACNSFKQFGVRYTGIDIELEYLKIARKWFKDTNLMFLEHDITARELSATAKIVICSATIEHCISLFPALANIVNATEDILVLRTFLGETENIYSIPSPVTEYSHTHRKYTNQYAFKDVLTFIQNKGFKIKVLRDRYTGSIPQLIDGTMRTFYIVYAERNKIGH